MRLAHQRNASRLATAELLMDSYVEYIKATLSRYGPSAS